MLAVIPFLVGTLALAVSGPVDAGEFYARTTLELAWRYSDLGFLQTGQGQGCVIWRDGSREPLLLDLAVTRAKLKGHGLRLSLRFAL